MKKTIITILITFIITFIVTALFIMHTLKITNIKNDKITINILGQEQIYKIEK